MSGPIIGLRNFKQFTRAKEQQIDTLKKQAEIDAFLTQKTMQRFEPQFASLAPQKPLGDVDEADFKRELLPVLKSFSRPSEIQGIFNHLVSNDLVRELGENASSFKTFIGSSRKDLTLTDFISEWKRFQDSKIPIADALKNIKVSSSGPIPSPSASVPSVDLTNRDVLNRLTRDQLDNIGKSLGLIPSDYSNKQKLISAIVSTAVASAPKPTARPMSPPRKPVLTMTGNPLLDELKKKLDARNSKGTGSALAPASRGSMGRLRGLDSKSVCLGSVLAGNSNRLLRSCIH